MSDGMLQHFQQLYRSMETEALIDLQRKGTLRPEAEEILYAELETRGVSMAERVAIASELEATSHEDQFQHHGPIGSRIMARVIDSVISVGLACTVGFLTLKLLAPHNGAWLLLMPAAFCAYLLFADCMANGQSFGKKWNGIAVVDVRTHAPCNAIQSLIRNLLLPLFGIIDLAIMLNHGTRGGDRLARTLVVKAEYLNKPPL